MLARARLRWTACALLVACNSPSGPAPGERLEVWVQMDLEPELEVNHLLVQAVNGAGETQPEALVGRPLFADEDWFEVPQLLADIDRGALGPDVGFLEVSAVGRDGRVIVRKRPPIGRLTQRVDVRFWRGCIGARCDFGGHCLGGRCVHDECQRGDEPECLDPQCASDIDCVLPDAPCAGPARCDRGVCFRRLDLSACGPDRRCADDGQCVGRGQSVRDAVLGEACTSRFQCASRACVAGVCCERLCSPCQTCDSTGRCVPLRATTGNPPSDELCNDLDDDCDGFIDEEGNAGTDASCGACNVRCATDERCDGQRCVVDDACERYFGRGCEEVLVATLRPPGLQPVRFGEHVALDDDVLVVAAPDGFGAPGVDPSPAEWVLSSRETGLGVVYVYGRTDAGWELEASLRPEGDALLIGGAGLGAGGAHSDAAFGTHLDLRDGTLVVADLFNRTSRVHVFRRSAEGSWSVGPTLSYDEEVVGLALVDAETVAMVLATVTPLEQRLQVQRLDGEVLIEGASRRRSQTVLTSDGGRVVYAAGGDLMAGRPEGLLTPLPIDIPLVTSLHVVDEGRIFAAGAPFPSGLLVFDEGDAGWTQRRLDTPESAGPLASVVALPGWVAVGAPFDQLADASGIGPDLRLRPGRRELRGSVFLYPRSADGLPFDAPIYLRPFDTRGVAEHGAALATDGRFLVVGAPGTETQRSPVSGGPAGWSPPDTSPVATGAVTIWQLGP
ncbi:MAG: hypothetical protein AAGH15_07620 [Myxococcota bacterium]